MTPNGEELKAQAGSHQAVTRTLVAGESSARCFGREQELSELVALVEGALRDEAGRVVVVEGDTGMGKSRLGAALSAELTGRGLTVLSGRCRDGVHHAATYRPLVEIVEGAISALDAAGERGIAERGREVAAALAGRAFTGAVGASWIERRSALFDSVSGFLIDTSRLLRVAIIVHDLDAADGATRELVAHLAAAGAPAAALASGAAAERLRGALILIARTVDESLLSGVAVSTVRLRPLDEAGVRAFLNSPEVVSFFAEATGGRPRALEALLESVPVDANDLLRARWLKLDPAAQRLAAALAVAGRPMSLVDLGRVASLDDHALPGAAQALSAAHLCRRQVVEGQFILALCHRGDEEAIYALIPATERAPLHRALGGLLATSGGDDLLDRVRVAEHLLHGGAGVAAVEAAIRAASALELTFGYDRAVDLLQRAHAVAVVLPPSLLPDNLVADLDERLCELERLIGDYEAAMTTARRIEARVPGAAARRRIAALHVLRDELELALEALDDAARLAEAEGCDVELSRIAAARAEALYLAGRSADAKLAAQLSLTHGDDPEASARRLEVCNTLGKVALAEARYADAAALFSDNVAPARALGSSFEEARALFNLGIAELRMGEHGKAQARYQAALEIAESAGDHRNRAFCLQNLAVLAHWRGDYATALNQFQLAIAAFRRTALGARQAWVALDLASVYIDLRDLDSARSAFEIATHFGGGGMPSLARINADILSARMAALAGDASVAEAAAARALDAAVHSGQAERAIEASQIRCRLRLESGDLDGAATMLGALPVSTSARTQLRSDVLRGEMHVRRERGLEARRLLRDALATAQRIADLESEWRIHYWLGRTAEAMRDPSEGERRFRSALASDKRLRERVPTAHREAFVADPLRRALDRALGLPVVVALPMPARPRPRLVEDQVVDAKPLLGRMAGTHPRMRQVCALVERAAPADSTVLIRGESGTGKELIAEALHEGSPRRSRPFVKVNCGAIVESLLLSELFGHERGAFTGAMQRKKGRFEVADGGTLFLDEIGDVSPRTQVALLRVLQERQFERVGGTAPVRVDVRILCATHRNLEEMVARGEFREDLYYRLRGIQLELPALRERASDIPIIARSILAELGAQRGLPPLRLSADALALLQAHTWPGNVRELENVLRSASLFADHDEIGAHDLSELVSVREPRALSTGRPDGRESEPLALPAAGVARKLAAFGPGSGSPGSTLLEGASPNGVAPEDPAEQTWRRLASEGLSLKELKTRVEIECIERALAASGGNITRAADTLGMKRPRLSQLIKEHGLRAALLDPCDYDTNEHSSEENL